MVNLGREKDKVHMKLGVITEVGEFLDVIKKNLAYGKEIDRVNLLEEIADICWYISNEATLDGILLDNLVEHKAIPKDLLEIQEYMVNFLSAYLINNTFTYQSMMYELYIVSLELGFDLFLGLENNINKLKIRFPDKFSAENALNRNLIEERKQLENENN